MFAIYLFDDADRCIEHCRSGIADADLAAEYAYALCSDEAHRDPGIKGFLLRNVTGRLQRMARLDGAPVDLERFEVKAAADSAPPKSSIARPLVTPKSPRAKVTEVALSYGLRSGSAWASSARLLAFGGAAGVAGAFGGAAAVLQTLKTHSAPSAKRGAAHAALCGVRGARLGLRWLLAFAATAVGLRRRKRRASHVRAPVGPPVLVRLLLPFSRAAFALGPAAAEQAQAAATRSFVVAEIFAKRASSLAGRASIPAIVPLLTAVAQHRIARFKPLGTEPRQASVMSRAAAVLLASGRRADRARRSIADKYCTLAAALQRRMASATATRVAAHHDAPPLTIAARKLGLQPGYATTRMPRVSWRIEPDYVVLAAFGVAAMLVGSPLYSIYSTARALRAAERPLAYTEMKSGVTPAALFEGRSASVLDRGMIRSALDVVAQRPEGDIDFRRLVRHIKVVTPAEIHVALYDADRPGARSSMVFTTSNLLTWHLSSLRLAEVAEDARRDPSQSRQGQLDRFR